MASSSSLSLLSKCLPQVVSKEISAPTTLKYCADKNQLGSILSLIVSVAGLYYSIFQNSMVGIIGFILMGISTLILRKINVSMIEENSLLAEKIICFTSKANTVIHAKELSIIGLAERVRTLEEGKVHLQAQYAHLQHSHTACAEQIAQRQSSIHQLRADLEQAHVQLLHQQQTAEEQQGALQQTIDQLHNQLNEVSKTAARSQQSLREQTALAEKRIEEDSQRMSGLAAQHLELRGQYEDLKTRLKAQEATMFERAQISASNLQLFNEYSALVQKQIDQLSSLVAENRALQSELTNKL